MVDVGTEHLGHRPGVRSTLALFGVVQQGTGVALGPSLSLSEQVRLLDAPAAVDFEGCGELEGVHVGVPVAGRLALLVYLRLGDGCGGDRASYATEWWNGYPGACSASRSGAGKLLAPVA